MCLGSARFNCHMTILNSLISGGFPWIAFYLEVLEKDAELFCARVPLFEIGLVVATTSKGGGLVNAGQCV